MKQSFVLLIHLFLIACSNRAIGQIGPQKLICDKQIIQFDSNGRMISFPKVYVRQNTKLQFRVVVPTGMLQEQWTSFTKMLKETEDRLTSEPDIKKIYPCVFGPEYKMYLDNIDVLLRIMGAGLPCGKNDLKKLLSYVDTLPSQKEDGSIKQAKVAISDLIPVKEYLSNMIDSQYAVEISNGTVCKRTLLLKADLKHCNSSCIVFESELKKIKNELCRACGVKSIDQLEFKLIRKDPMNKTLRSWNDLQLSRLAIKDPEQINVNVNSMANDSCCGKAILAKMAVFREWFIGWFWFTKGELSWNPFTEILNRHELSQPQIKSLNAEIKRRNRQLDSAKQMVSFLDSIKVHVKEKLQQIDEMKVVINDRKTTDDFLETVTAERKNLQDSLNKYKPGKIGVYEYLYDGNIKLSRGFLMSRDREINPLKQFNAAKKYKEVKQAFFQRQKVRDIPESEEPWLLVHNIPTGTLVQIQENLLPFDDMEEFTKVLNEQLPKINFTDLTAATIGTAQDFVKSFTFSKHAYVSAFSNLPGAGNNLDSIQCVLKGRFMDSLLLKLSTSPVGNHIPKSNIFEDDFSGDPHYYSYLKQANTDAAPFKDSFAIKIYHDKDSAVASKSTFLVGKLRYIQLAAGIAITKNPASTTTIDTAGNGFRTSSQDNRARLIVGLKIYPFKNFNRDNGIIPRYFFHRVSAFAGFEILHPINNFYFGGAYDIIPGLSFSIGTNYYLQTNYKVRGNAITDTWRTYKSSGVYYSVTLNPVIFVQVVKLIVK